MLRSPRAPPHARFHIHAPQLALRARQHQICLMHAVDLREHSLAVDISARFSACPSLLLMPLPNVRHVQVALNYFVEYDGASELQVVIHIGR
eukprot:1259822-Prymnesium_polylepis.1